MSYDLIIVSKSIPEVINMTQHCINTALADGVKVNVILVETGPVHQYDGVNKLIKFEGEFNYHRAMNEGLKYQTGDIHILANNDIVFRKGWSLIGPLMKANGYHSASCVTQKMKYPKGMVYEGYHIGSILAGWCIFIDDYVLEKIGKLDESVSFWFSDNLYGCQLRAAGIPHGMFTDCVVDHIGSFTLKKHPQRIRRKMETGEMAKYNIRKQYYDTRN